MFIPKEVTMLAAKANISIRTLTKTRAFLVHTPGAKLGFVTPNINEVQSLVAAGARMYPHALAAGFKTMPVKGAR